MEDKTGKKRGRPPGTSKTDEEKNAAKKKRENEKKQTRQQKEAMASFLGRGAAANDSVQAAPSSETEAAQEEDPVLELPEREEINPSPIAMRGSMKVGEAGDSGDDNEDEDDEDDDDDDAEAMFEGLHPEGAMKTYLQKVFDRLKLETKKDSPVLVNNWLIPLLRENDWRIPAARAKHVCKKLGIEYDEPSYYRDIVVWLPDEQFGEDPPCPRCARGCSFHGWQTNHFGRVVLTLYSHYYVISRRYKCPHCESAAKQQKDMALTAARQAAAVHGATIESVIDDTEIVTETTTRITESDTASAGVSTTTAIDAVDGSGDNPSSYTFMGYNARSRELLRDGLGDLFPAFLTHKGAVDMVIIDLMRPLLSVGVRPKQVSDIMLELASKKYSRDYLRREQDIK